MNPVHPEPRPSRPSQTLSARVTTLPTSTRYAIALAAAAAAVAGRLALDPVWGDDLPFITLFPAVMLSAWLGGFWPGVVATLTSAAAAEYYWLTPVRSWWVSDPREWVGLAVFVSIGVVISALNEAWRRSAAALLESEQRLTVTLSSIGDAVLTADIEGRVTGLNPVAEALTGWKASDALGRRLEEVLVIVNERSGEPADNPIERVLREGVVVGLANGTMLIARDGRRLRIEDSAAPIRLEDGTTTGAIMVFRDITERRLSEEDRARQHRVARELAAIVESSDDAIVSKDLESTITSWNRGAERIFGYSAEEMIGRSIRTIIPLERWSEEDEVLSQIRQGNRVDHYETVRRRKDGSFVDVSLTISPLYSAEGTVVGASKIARDISERRQIEAERERLLAAEQDARAELERAHRLKDDFLAVLSHELRTPLNAVMGYAQLLSSGALPPEKVQHAYGAIMRNAQAQKRLVESLLDLSRVLAGKLELALEILDLQPVLDAAVDALQPEALKGNVVLDVRRSDRRIRVAGDGPRLQQVFWNCLSNAIKFTPPGGRVRATVTTSGGEAHIEIADNGCGISPELLPFVFDRFTQGGHGHGGLGIGLALVRELVLGHGGRVTAASDGDGCGSVLTVSLPLAVGSTRTVSSPADEEADLAASHPRILIVDDEHDARDMRN